MTLPLEKQPINKPFSGDSDDQIIPQSPDYVASFAAYIALDLMYATVFLTVVTGFLTYVLGQLAVKLVIEPVQEAKKSIGSIAHALIEHANVVGNPGVPSAEVMEATSKHMRQLSSQLQSHLYLVPSYDRTAKIFYLPSKANILKASSNLIGLSNSVYRASDRVYEANAKRVEGIRDALGIFMSDDERWPKGLT